MNKTISIGLAGFSFMIEEISYNKLNDYLNALRNSLGKEESEEVMQDIEARIAEIFKESTGTREVINEADVQKVIDQIGTPEKIEEQEEAYYSENVKDQKCSFKGKQKQFFRDEEGGMIGGVASGLGYYFGIDKVWIRLAFVLIFFAGMGSSLLIYIVLWIVIPRAEIASDFLKMRGRLANFDNIKEFANESGRKIENTYNSNKENINKIGNTLWNITRFGLGCFFMLISFGLFIGSLALLGFSGSNNVQFFENVGFYLQENNLGYLVIGLGFLTLFLPAILSMFLAIKLFSPKIKFNYIGYIIGILVAVWLISCIATGYHAIQKQTLYSGNNEETERIDLENESDTIFVDLKKVPIREDFKAYWDNVYSDKKTIFKKEYIDIDIERSNVTKPYLSIRKRADGYNHSLKLNTSVEIIGNQILIPNYISYPYQDRFRDYKVDYTLVVPYSTKVINRDGKLFLDENYHYKSHKNRNVRNKQHDMNFVPNKENPSDSHEDSIIINGEKEAVKDIGIKK